MDLIEADIVQFSLTDSDTILPELDIKSEESIDETPNVTVFQPLSSSKKPRGKFDKCAYDVSTDSE